MHNIYVEMRRSSMELRQLEYFLSVCDELHFTRAAEKIGISQPNLSLSIKALEAEIGLPLFNRIGKKIELTSAGIILEKNTRIMLQTLKNTLTEINDLSNQNGGSLSVAVLPSELDYRLTPMFIRFMEKYPQIKLRIFNDADVTGLVLNTPVDIGIAIIQSSNSQLVVRPLSKEKYGIAVSKEHALAHESSIPLNHLKLLPIVSYPKGVWGRDYLEDWCQQHGFSLNIVVETSSNPSLFNFVKANIGVAIVASSLLEYLDNLGLRFIPIQDNPPIREMGIIYRSDKYVSHAVRAFISFAEEQLKGENPDLSSLN